MCFFSRDCGWGGRLFSFARTHARALTPHRVCVRTRPRTRRRLALSQFADFVTSQTDLSREAENLLRFIHNFRNRLDYVTFPRPVRL